MGIVDSITIKSEEVKILHSLLQIYVPDAEVRAFGSRVNGTARSSSDLDIVVFATPEQVAEVEDLKEAFEQSDLPFRVDCHIWSELPNPFQHIIAAGYYLLQETRSA
ncbi:MAG: putative nucleotidyltransferase [Lentimonas sp.]|jgi:predicted nucleotidyltransferase